MQDYILDYWKEALSNSIEDAGLGLLPDNALSKIANDMAMASETQSMAFSGDFKPSKNVKSDEVRRLEAKIKELEKNGELYKSSVASKLRVPTSDVYINNGVVTYDIVSRY